MSYSVSWIAVRGKTPRKIRLALGLQASGVWQPEPDCPIAGAMLTSGWYLVRAEGFTSVLSDPTVGAELSQGCDLVTCSVNEAEHLSAAGQWENGERLWVIRHDGWRGRRSVETYGTLPLGFESIEDELLELEEADRDAFYEMPINAAEALTGYRHDAKRTNIKDNGYELLIAGRGSESGGMGTWWKRLFSGMNKHRS
jgi:hypothetical protein